MPIRINLLAEHFELEEQKRRDPVKRAIMAGAALASLVVLYCISVMLQARAIEQQLAGKRAEYGKIEGKFKEAMRNNQVRSELGSKIEALEKFAAERFLWAPSLSALQYTLIPNIQLTRIMTEQKFMLTNSIPDTTDKSGNKKPGKKGGASEEIVLNIDGMDFGRQGTDNHIAFQRALAEYSFFKTNLAPDGIRLTRQDAATLDPESGKPFSSFSFSCAFPKRIRPAK